MCRCPSRAWCATVLLRRWPAAIRKRIGPCSAASPQKTPDCRRLRAPQVNCCFRKSRWVSLAKTPHQQLRGTLNVSSHEACDDTVVGEVGVGDRSKRRNWHSACRRTSSRQDKSRADGTTARAFGRTGKETGVRSQNPNKNICGGSDGSRSARED